MFVDVNNQCVFINMSVGAGSKSVNLKSDVEIVQLLLNKHVGRLVPNRSPLQVTGIANAQTIQAIKDFQKQCAGFNFPDGRVDPAGKTLSYLNQPATPFPKSPGGTPSTPSSPEGTLAAFIESLELRHIPVKQVTEGFNRVKYYGSKTHSDLPKGKGRNSEPPMALWHNIAPTLIVLDEIAEQLGREVNPTNTYRAPEYNHAKRMAGKIWRVEQLRAEGKDGKVEDMKSEVAKMSQHMSFRAIDFKAGNKLSEALEIAKSLRGRTFSLPRPIRMSNPVVKKVGDCGGKAGYFNEGALKLTDTSFEFHGGMKLYAGSNFIHIDCRGKDDNYG